MARPFKGVTFHDRVRAGTVINAETGCHEWTGCRSDDGYGRIYRDGRLVYIHRSLWEDVHGPLPEGIEVCHSCDNPSCLNQEHHFAGTHRENMQDMIRKGRRRNLKGSEKPGAKLDDAKVVQIRSALARGESCASLGRRYGVTEIAIGFIKRGRTWRHVQAA